MPRTWDAQPPFTGTLVASDFLYGQDTSEVIVAQKEQRIPVQKLLDIISLNVAYEGGPEIIFDDDTPIILNVDTMSNTEDILYKLTHETLSATVNLYEMHKSGLHRQQPVDIIEKNRFNISGLGNLPFWLSQTSGSLYIANTELNEFTVLPLDNPFDPTLDNNITGISPAIGSVRQVEERGGIIYVLGDQGIAAIDKATHVTLSVVEHNENGVVLNGGTQFTFQGDTIYASGDTSNTVSPFSYANNEFPIIHDAINDAFLGGGTPISKPRQLKFYGNRLFIANEDTDQITILEIPRNTPADASVFADVDDGNVSGSFTWALDQVQVLEISGTLGFAAGKTPSETTYTAQLFNVTNSPFNILSQVILPSQPHQVTFNNQYLLVSYFGTTVDMLSVYDISDPENPILVRHFTNSDFSISFSQGLAVRGNEIYMGTRTGGNSGIIVLSLEGIITQSIAAGTANFGTLDAKTAKVKTLQVDDTIAAYNGQFTGILGAQETRTGNHNIGDILVTASAPTPVILDFQYDYSIVRVEVASSVNNTFDFRPINVRKGHKIRLVYDSFKNGVRGRFTESIWKRASFAEQQFENSGQPITNWAELECMEDILNENIVSASEKILFSISF